MKKFFNVLVAMLLVSSLIVGCSSGKGNEGASKENQESTNNVEKTEEKKETEEVEEPYTVAIQLVNISTDLVDIESVEKAINEITVPAINSKVDIQNIFIGDLPTTTSMNIVSNEKMDLVVVGLTQKISSVADSGILLPLDDYMQYAPTYVSLVEEYLGAGNIGGIQYAIPATPYVANGKGFAYNKDMADKYGIALKDGATFKDFSDAFAVLAEQGIYGTTNGEGGALNAQFWYNTEIFGRNGEYGAIIDPVNNTTIENFFASDIFKEFAYQMKEWRELKYMPADAVTDTTTVQEYFAAERIFGTVTDYNMAQFSTWQAGQNFNIDIVEVKKPIVGTAGVVERMWGIASNSENPQKAMEFLEYIYVNPDVANLLQYGIEGQNYTIAEGTEKVTTTEGTTTGSKGYTSMFTQYGNPVEIYTALPNTDSYAEDVLAYNKGVDVSKILGYSFDSTDFSAEAGAVSNVIAEYSPRLHAGQVDDVDAYLAEFLAALDKAGYNDIVAGNQVQLDAYLAQQ